MSQFTPAQHAKHKKTATWSTENERSGDRGIKWNCDTCGFMMVFIEGYDPNENDTSQPPTNSEDALDAILTRLENEIAHDVMKRMMQHSSGKSPKLSHAEAKTAIRDWVRAETDMAKLQLLTELADKKILTIKTSEIRDRL